MDLQQHRSLLFNSIEDHRVDVQVFDESLQYLLEHLSLQEMNSLRMDTLGYPTPILHMCLKTGQGRAPVERTHMAVSLINAGLDVNLHSEDNPGLPLELAIEYNHNILVIDALLQHGANVYGTIHKKTYLGMALHNERFDISRSLIRAGFDINTNYRVCVDIGDVYRMGQVLNVNALFYSICTQHIHIALFLLEHGADPNHTTLFVPRKLSEENMEVETHLITPLYLGLMLKNIPLTGSLLEANANPNFVSDNGQPLLVQFMNNIWQDGRDYVPVLRLLLRRGADPFVLQNPAIGTKPIFYDIEQRAYDPRVYNGNPAVRELLTFMRNKKLEAVGMAGRPRLGNGSNASLPPELMRQIMNQIDFD